jgi:hypothetical protein
VTRRSVMRARSSRREIHARYGGSREGYVHGQRVDL